MSRPFLFLASVALQLCILATAYYFLVLSRIPYNDPPESYNEFLLERVVGPRIIIDGGSSSYTGIDNEMMEEVLGLPVVNVADNAGYPLFFKAVRLERVTNPGDLVILPLEWNHYVANRASDVFFRDLFGPFNRYFWHLGPLERIKTVFSIPPRDVAHQFRQPSPWINMDLDRMRGHLGDYLKRAHNGRAGGGAILEESVPLHESTELLTCDQYLFGRYDSNWDIAISRYFLDSLGRLKELQQRGVTVVITWPSVVDEDCYTSDRGIADFMRDVERTIVEGGLRVLAKPEDSRFPRRLIHDTYYHLNDEGREIRTKQLIEDLRSANLIPPNPAGVPIRDQLEDIISKDLRRLDSLIQENIREWPGGLLKVGDSAATRFLDFERGWHKQEKWGRWSDGRQSVLKFRLPASSHGATLRVWGVYFEDPEHTEVLVNGSPVGSFRFDSEEQVEIPISAEGIQVNDGIVTVTFKHQNPVSPLEIGQSEDPRKLKLGIGAVELVWG